MRNTKTSLAGARYTWMAALAACLPLGCATALSSFQPAHVPREGHFQTEVGLDISESVGAINRVLDAAETLDEAATERSLTQDEQRQILEGGAHLGLNPPAFIPHAGLAYSPLERWEASLRFAATGWRIGVRRQLLEQDRAGVDFTVGVGFGTALFDPPIHEILGTIEVNDFARYNLDLPITVGTHGSWYRWWAGPRLLYSAMSETMTLTLRVPNETKVTGSVSGQGLYVGGAAGAALGYRSLFIGPELVVVELVGSAEVRAVGTTTRASLDSFIVYPAIALMGEF
jgi:hypothetical protein